jgi:hypothetical protein
MPNREQLQIQFRRHQIVNDTGNVVIQCNPDDQAEYVPGTVDPTWVDVSDYTRGLDKLNLSWDRVNNGKSADTTETNPGGSNYDKGISLELTFNDRAFQFLDTWLLSNPCGTLNSVDVLITDRLCQKNYRLFEIKADNLDYSPYAEPCEVQVKLREADPVWHCVHKTFIWDNWQNWFIDGSSKQHPCFLTAVEPRPRLLASARMALSIFGQSIPLISALFNENDDVFRRILNVDNFVDAPLIRDIISNACGKCGLAVDTIFHDPDSPYYNACLYYPNSGAVHVNDGSSVTSPALWFHFENRWNVTLAELLDKLKPVVNAEWYVTPNSTLVFQPAAEFLNTAPVIDFTDPANRRHWDPATLRYQFNGEKKPAYGRYQYTIDPSDLATQEAAPLYNDIVDFDGDANNPMLEGNVTNQLEFAATGFVRDGRAKEDYLIRTVSDGETGAYALLIVLTVVIAALLAGVLSAAAAAALAGFLALWAATIASKANDTRDLFSDAKYTGAVRLTCEQVGTPRIIIWDGVSLNRAKAVAIDQADIDPNPYYNSGLLAYTTRNKFMYGPAGVFNYPMYFDSYFLDNLFDRFHDALDNPLKSVSSHQNFNMKADLCCQFQDALGVWVDDFARIGYFVVLEDKGSYLVKGRIEHIELAYDDQQIGLKGQVFKVNVTP